MTEPTQNNPEPQAASAETPAQLAGEIAVEAKQVESLEQKLTAMQKVAVFLEQSRLGDYVDLMNRPRRLVWLNFVAGVSRGVGMAIGGSIIFVVVVYVSIIFLKSMVHHVGGLPWIGQQMQEGITWILQVIENYKGHR